MLRVVKLILVVVWVALWWLPVAAAHLLKKKKLRADMVKCFCRGMLLIVNVRVQVVGELSPARPLLVASNHLSYLDIPILASVLDCRFVPKKEIASWPVINLICAMMDVVYVDRSPGKIHEGNAAIQRVLAQGEVVALFPEATTGDGRLLLPFRPAFFEAAGGAVVQPVAIAYRKVCGLPIDYGQWPMIAWYGDMSLVPHLWNFLGLGRVEVELHFLPPLAMGGEGRKTMAIQTHTAVLAALNGEPAASEIS